MKLTVFGATGGVGMLVVKQALAQGHDVTAFVRSPEKISDLYENIEIIQGDVLDPVAVRKALQGRDAAVCALGMPLMNKDGLRAKGTKNIVDVMEGAGVKRLICLSAFGVGDSWRLLPLIYRLIIVPLFLRRVIADHTAQEAHIRASGLDWTIVRPGNFVKGGLTGDYRHGVTDETRAFKLKISREDVADFLVKQLTGSTYLRQSPGLSY
ncbi:MAG: SDR family oxidoreductase [Rhodobacteraceae bacterium]|nr:SDR family oxidoreductase [Paracoccaceae bacterium]